MFSFNLFVRPGRFLFKNHLLQRSGLINAQINTVGGSQAGSYARAVVTSFDKLLIRASEEPDKSACRTDEISNKL